jgi:hypothetical protein
MWALAIAVAAGATACSTEPDALQIPTGTQVSLEKTDGVTVAGTLVEVRAQEVVLAAPDGRTTRVPRREIRSLKTAALGPPEGAAQAQKQAAGRPQPDTVARRAAAPAASRAAFEEHQVAAGTSLPIELRTPIASDESHVEDEIRGRLTRAVVVNGVEVVPQGATVRGTVMDVERSARVKGLARVAFRFSVLEHPDTGSRVSIRTSPIVRQAEPTKKKDAAKIGGAAAGGAVIGGILGGGDGAAKGAAIGGAAGTGVVLSTRGQEVHLPAGTIVSAQLTEPFVVRIPSSAH